MIFKKSKLEGVFFIKPEKLIDSRGFFGRTFDKLEFSKNGLETEFIQQSISFNEKMGTIRGMHYQTYPHEEDKLVHCSKGKFFDVILDLREKSQTYLEWDSIEVSSDNNLSVYIPKGFAHGFQTLEDETILHYQMSEYFKPENYTGFRWDDRRFNITWPLPLTRISDKDSSYPDFK